MPSLGAITLDFKMKGIQSGLGKLQSGLNRTNKSVTKTAGRLAKGAALPAAAAAAGVTAFVGSSLKDFVSFESGMNEVFTLIPNASKEAMGKMTEDVKDFSTKFGTLPEETVPALYQALSAGVPKDNVFEFLETAQKAAVGGVTDLETAVDGISSVVNAYGDDVISSTEASDLMFTAVKGGKTTFEELSSSLFQVIPTASSLGVGFGDVTAALATMTSQGTPTKVATTQLRQAFVELSKEGGETATTFEKLSGKSFADFIAEGGNTQEALQLLEGHAEDTGVSIADMFGSVEAGNAALALTGKGTDKYATELEAAGGSADATQTAYEKMEEGIGRSLDKLKSAFKVLKLNIGEKFAPALATAADFLVEKMPEISDKVEEVFGIIGDAISDFVGGLKEGGLEGGLKAIFSDKTAKAIVTAIDTVKIALKIITKILGFVKDNANILIPVLGGVVAAFIALNIVVKLVTGIQKLAKGMRTVYSAGKLMGGKIKGLVGKLRNFGKAMGRAVVAIGKKIVALGRWAAATAAKGAKAVASLVKTAATFVAQYAMMAAKAMLNAIKMAASWVIAMGPIGWVIAAIIALVAVIILNWDTVKKYTKIVWDWISNKIVVVWDAIKAVVGAAIEFVKTVIVTYLEVIKTIWGTVWDAIKLVVETVWNAIKWYIETYINTVKTIIETVLGIIETVWDTAWSAIKTIADTIWGAIKTAIDTYINTVKTVIETVMGTIKGIWDTIWGTIETAFTNTWDAITGAVNTITEWVGIVKDALSGIKDAILGPFKDAYEAVEEKIGQIRGVVEKLNPFSSNSPPPVNEIMKGMKALRKGMNKEFSGINADVTGQVQLTRNMTTELTPALAQADIRSGDQMQSPQAGGLNIENMTVVASDPREFMEAMDKEISMRGRARGIRS